MSECVCLCLSIEKGDNDIRRLLQTLPKQKHIEDNRNWYAISGDEHFQEH